MFPTFSLKSIGFARVWMMAAEDLVSDPDRRRWTAVMPVRGSSVISAIAPKIETTRSGGLSAICQGATDWGMVDATGIEPVTPSV